MGSVAAAVGLVVVVAAFLLDRPDEGAGPTASRPPGLPRPSEIRSLRFPTTWWGGYDHRAVDAELADLSERYEALYLAAGPSVLAAAERRLTEGEGTADTPPAGSAEELEDGGGDGAGVLDR